MSLFKSGDRVYITIDGSGRQGTVRECLSSPPPMATRGSGPWYVVRWDAMPQLGHGVQDGHAQECDIARVRP